MQSTSSRLTCSCGNTFLPTPPRKKSGAFVPTCPNCGNVQGVTIHYERIDGEVTLKIEKTGLTVPSRRVDLTAIGADLTPLESYFAAKYPALLIETQEPLRTINEIRQVCERNDKPLFVWDCVKGIESPTTSGFKSKEMDPPTVLDESCKLPEKSVLILKNFHHFIRNVANSQRIENYAPVWKQRGQTIIVLAPNIALPVEVERLFTVLDAKLPDRHSILQIIRQILDNHKMKEPENLSEIVNAATGLTAYEIENALCLSILQTGALTPQVIATEKAQLIKKHGGLEMASFKENFKNLGGWQNLRHWVLNRFKMHRATPTLPLRGVLVLGPPGVGKSHFAKALGNEVGLPTLLMDFGKMFTGEGGREGIVGSAEAMMRRALKIADAMAPAIIMADEIDKGMSGMASSNMTDGGTGSRLFGTFLTWLQDHKSEVFVIASANSVSHIPPEFLRVGRWDGLFFADLPGEQEQIQILEMYAKEYHVTVPATIQDDVNMNGWTGAEIRQLCIEAAYHGGDFSKAAEYVVPLSFSADTYITAIRNWAESRCIPAGTPKPPKRAENGQGADLPQPNAGGYF